MFFDHISISDRKASALHLASSSANEGFAQVSVPEIFVYAAN
jgi:hypothetical protein